MHRAVFLDRDGTISQEVGYPSSIEQIHLFPWSAAAIRRLNQAGMRVILVTNQSGVARGYFSEDRLNEIHEWIRVRLGSENAHLDGIYYCPHHPEATVAGYRLNCACRKPGIGMMEQAARDLSLDLSSSYVIGDKYIDIETAFRARARGILVLTGYGKEQLESYGNSWERPPDFIARDLAEATEWILRQPETGSLEQA